MPDVSAESVVPRPIRGRARAAPAASRVEGRNRYLTGAICVAICAVMVDAGRPVGRRHRSRRPRRPPPSRRRTSRAELSFDSYVRLWDYQAGLPHYLMNSLGTALLTIVHRAGPDDPGRLRAGPPAGPGQGDHLRLPADGPDHPVPGAADADVPDVRPAQADELDHRPRDPPHDDPAAVQPVHHAQQLRGRAARARGSGRDRRRRRPGRS